MKVQSDSHRKVSQIA